MARHIYKKIVPPPLAENQQAHYCRKGYTAINAHIVSVLFP